MSKIDKPYTQKLAMLFICLGITLQSCFEIKPKPVSLPAATQTGANTFGCKVNGEIWVANGNSPYPSIESPSYKVETGNFGFDGWNTKDFEGRVYVAVSCNNCFGVGVYTDMYPYSEYFLGSIGNIVQGGGHLDTSGTSMVEITRFAPEKGIMSGTFEYDLYDKTHGQKIKITEGRFDLSGVYVF
jgi:hypothetical protein